jgi:penicillin amidase
MDRTGNIAYFTSAELPLREDLQAGFVDGGIPPFFVRDGTGTLRHEWIRNDNPPPDQALRCEILPFDKMPQVVNPPKGFIVNANNDPIGTSIDNNPLNQLRPDGHGILYLSPGYAIGNRAARIDSLIRRKLDEGRISFEDMGRIQADVQLLDIEPRSACCQTASCSLRVLPEGLSAKRAPRG